VVQKRRIPRLPRPAARPEEVRYQLLRPHQIVARRTACPVAYIPVGTLEWHGVHNPVGTDTLQAEEFAVRCARKGGGLAFPPLYYGESRSEALMEANAADRARIADKMGLPVTNFDPVHQYFPPNQQTENYHRLLLHILTEVETLGFKVGVLVAGHYPLIDHCRSAVLAFSKRTLDPPASGRMLAWAFVDYLLVNDRFDCAGDHAGGWETSHMLAIRPESVDLSLLPPRGEALIGAGGRMDPRDANAAFGRKTIEAAVDIAVREARHRLEQPQRYRGHGTCLLEKRWTDRT
jgi:creatinine amidohydrolase